MGDDKPRAFKKPNPMGRPQELTDELQEKICLNIRLGAYIETAVLSTGITKTTFYKWLKKGNQQKSGKFRDFVNAVEHAQQQSEMDDVMRLAKFSEKELSALKWRMERKHPKRWGPKSVIKLEDENTKVSALNEDSIHQKIVDLIEEAESEPGTEQDE